MANKEKVDIKRSDDFQEVEEALARAMADLDFTIERVSAIFDGTADENTPVGDVEPNVAPAPEGGEGESADEKPTPDSETVVEVEKDKHVDKSERPD